MATVDQIQKTLDVLCRYYTDKGEPRKLNAVQVTVYLDGLCEFAPDELEFAARRWMKQSKWFPALSDLREQLVEAAPDWTALGHVAWSTVERAISAAGLYRGATFEDGAIGETVRQVFGSWSHACNYERDSPGWAMRKQTFLQVFPMVAKRAEHPPAVTMKGISPIDKPLLIPHVELLPAVVPKLAQRDESKNVLAEVTRRFKALRGETNV